MGSAIDPTTINRYELTEVYAHPDAKVDIVLVHGLNGDPAHTWTSPKGMFWPAQLLPVTLKSAKARILVYGYNADVYAFGSGGGPSTDMIQSHAQTLLTNLANERKTEEVLDHPIIWVAHSLGGILVKKALNLSSNLKDKNFDDLRAIAVSTYGIMFLGTPHTGADPAKWGLMLQRMVKTLMPKKVVATESILIDVLQKNNETLQVINSDFLEIYQNFQVCMAHETLETDFKGTRMLIVDNISASPSLPGVKYFGIEATHSGMCKFDTKNSPGWANIAGNIKTWVEESPQVIEARRFKEREDRTRNAAEKANELMRQYGVQPITQPSTSGNTPDPGSVNNSTIIYPPQVSIPPEDPGAISQLFIKPSGFRKNSQFVGRQKELSDMHRLLFEKRKADGTSAVLVQSLPGGGKTHLARQYVYQYKDSYPGGVFWLRAKSQEELAAGYWKMAKNTVLTDPSSKVATISRDDPRQYVKMVKKWLDRHHEWLLVLDGIHFDNNDELHQFLPDSENTSLIYTSTDRSVAGNHHLMDPEVIRLPSLSAREAQKLLLLELDKREPFQTDDLKYSMELVQAMGFLPIVIHTVARRLKLTQEPLSKFARSYAAEPKLSGLGTYKAVVEHLVKLGAWEALNLIRIICFYSQHIPVEMILLGLRVLDPRIPVKAKDDFVGRSLNNTFRHLNMFALTDRNEREEPTPLESSGTSRGSRDMLAENVDVIRLHGVVQGFFIDTLDEDKTLPEWLNRAVEMFCASYEHANDRIGSKTRAGLNAGLVEDYMLYQIHGKRLQRHLNRYERRYPVLKRTNAQLSNCLTEIEMEIGQRTPESSQTIAGGRPEAFQTSIFDRTSSSSDTAGASKYDETDRSTSGSPWFGEQEHLESPSSLTHDDDHARHPNFGDQDPTYRNQLTVPMPSEDGGYDSDMEGSVAMTLQPSQGTERQPATPLSPNGGWEVVKRPRKKMPKKFDPRYDINHRTTNRLENTRYHDRAGSYRSMKTVDPRISHEIAQGVLRRSSSRAQSRGRVSGQSSAEVSLTNIAHHSPPTARGGGMIRDRSSSQRPVVVRMRSGMPSYASAVTGPTREPISGLDEVLRPAMQPRTQINGTTGSPAYTSLKRVSIDGFAHLSPPSSPWLPLAMPPYPQTPSTEREDPLHFSDHALLGLDPQDSPMADVGVFRDQSLGQDNSRSSNREHLSGPPTEIYPMKTGPVPVETRSRAHTGPRKRDLPHGYPSWDSQAYVENEQQSPSLMSLSTSNLPTRPSTFIPGRPELSFHSTSDQHGYTSQPMSRDASGQSAHSVQSRGRDRRRPSVAETEPLPQVSFSPGVPTTSYQEYQEMNDQGHLYNRSEQERNAGYPRRKSPRIGYARPVRENLEPWGGGVENLPPTSIFSRANSSTAQPQPMTSSSSPLMPQGPNSAPQLSHPPPNSFNLPGYSHGQFQPPPPPQHRTSPPHPLSSHYAPPPPPQHRTSPPHSLSSQFLPPQSMARQISAIPRSFTPVEEPDPQAPKMERNGSGSGGMVVGGGIIGFGDIHVDVRRARARVDRTWMERKESGLGQVGLGISS
ncbi:hypothetical protein BJ875DRAFT_65725 [Amylocarpus encephaloides]|uniref:DUF676 domain-containing protein n=1 Tax=Amylocarpus encephaloides TaxID=45428 RepID=A0A9P7YH16_9HELO|nr:hypothetical protein BJ875DRAFT_65725 [Amylocarpus encephaloides]